MAFSHGSIVNSSNISRECMVKRSTVENYIEILKDLLIGYTLEVFSKRAKRALISHPKFYFFDAGVFLSLRERNLGDKKKDIEDSALEGIVAEHLRTWIDLQKEKHKFFFSELGAVQR